MNSARQIQTYVTILAVCKQSYLVYILGLAVRKLWKMDYTEATVSESSKNKYQKNIFRYVN